MLAGRLKRFLGSSPHLPWLLAGLALVLGTPVLRLGIVMDDRWHRAMLLHDARFLPTSVQRSPLDLFSFARGVPEERAIMLENGIGPWWMSDHLRIVFFRPLSSLTHVVDYALWPRSPVIMHLQSLLWYGAIVVLATILYRRIFARTTLAPWLAGLGALMYAVDGTHGLPVGWLANRNALVAATFAFGALLALDKRRPILSATLLALAFASAEAATAIVPFLFAHVVFLDDRARRDKLRTALPIALVVVAYVVMHRALSLGVRGSGIYVDPFTDLGAYARSVAVHLPMLVACELGAPTPDVFPLLDVRAQIAFVALSVAVLAWAAWSARTLRASKEMRFFVVGGVLGALPACATFPSARLLSIAGFGLVGALAMLAEDARARFYVAWAIGVRLVVSPFVFLLHAHMVAIMDGRIEAYASTIPDDPSVVSKRLVLVNAPDTAFAYYLLVNRGERGQPVPSKLLSLAGGFRDVTVTRTAERTLVVHAGDGFWRKHTEILFRSPKEPMPAGTRLAASDFTITVTHQLPDGVADEARFDFGEPLEGDHFLFMAWEKGALVPFALPNLGETKTLAGQSML